MFGVTFLGHQGWVVRSGSTCVLVDPLLNENFGEVHALEYKVHPPRILHPEKFPAIDAVFLSHEHDDHFDIPSLARLDRSIPIYLSAHSSTAAVRILREMGFSPRPLIPGIAIDVGDLDVVPFSGDHINVNCADEWDSLPFLVRDKRGAGSLFSTVDVMLLRHHVEWAKAYAPRPGLLTWSNNALDWSHMGEVPAHDIGTEQCFKAMASAHNLIAAAWGKPSATLMCAGGFSFTGEQEWFNRRVFWVDVEAVCGEMSTMHTDEGFFATLPGQTFWMEHNRLVKVDESTPFVGVAPREDWPVRARIVRPDPPDYGPACGRREIGASDRAKLEEGWPVLANALVGGILFRSLHSILAVEAMGRKPTFVFVLRHGSQGAADAYEYDASACTFVRVSGVDARETYVAGWECWASDLLAVLSGEIGPITLMFGRARLWNHLPQKVRFDLHEGLTKMSHPLSCPGQYLRNYERLWQNSRTVQPAFMGRPTRAVVQHVD